MPDGGVARALRMDGTGCSDVANPFLTFSCVSVKRAMDSEPKVAWNCFAHQVAAACQGDACPERAFLDALAV